LDNILNSSRHVYHGSISKPRAFHVAGLAAGELVRDRSWSEATNSQLRQEGEFTWAVKKAAIGS
jgi:hypothetical protein